MRSGWLIGMLLAVVLALGGDPGGAAQRQEAKARQEWTLARDGAEGLLLRIPAGNVRVVSGARDQFRVTVEKRVRADRTETARSFLERMEIERRREGGRWVVEAKWPEPRRHRVNSPYVNVEIEAPPGADLDARTGGGNMETEGVRNLSLHSGGGNITARDIAGRLEVDTGGGNITANGGKDARLHTGGGNIIVRDTSGRLKAHTGGGNVTIDGAVGPAEIETGGGNIRLHRATSSVLAKTGAGNIDVVVTRTGEPNVELHTGAGQIDLRLPDRISARVEANSGLGRVVMEPATSARFNRGRSHLDALLGDGKGSVRLNSGVGEIRIRLAAAR